MHKNVATHYTFILLLYKNVSELTRSSLNKTEQKLPWSMVADGVSMCYVYPLNGPTLSQE